MAYPSESLTRNSLLASDAAGEQHDGGGIKEALGGADGCFDVLGQSAVSVDLGEGALDHPASWQDVEADLIGDLLDDLDGDASGILDPLGAIGAAGECAFDEGERASRGL